MVRLMSGRVCARSAPFWPWQQKEPTVDLSFSVSHGGGGGHCGPTRRLGRGPGAHRCTGPLKRESSKNFYARGANPLRPLRGSGIDIDRTGENRKPKIGAVRALCSMMFFLDCLAEAAPPEAHSRQEGGGFLWGAFRHCSQKGPGVQRGTHEPGRRSRPPGRSRWALSSGAAVPPLAYLLRDAA